jgi:O-Antigen ligase
VSATAEREPVALRAPGWSRRLPRVAARDIAVSALAGALVLYLALEGGGYDVVVHNQVGVIVWWVVLVSAVLGLLPAGRLGGAAKLALALFGGFVAWTAIASTWSASSALSLDELSRVAFYLGVLVLALAIHRDRRAAVRQTIAALAAVVAFLAAVALISRLRPGTFAGAAQTAMFLPGSQGRLGWPINYWNGLGAFMALGLPLLLAVACSARRLAVQALAAAAIPMVVLCAYLTFSRGAALEAVCGVVVFFALTGDRIPKLLTGLLVAAGGAVLIAGAAHDSAIERGVLNAAARHEGHQLMIVLVLVCAGTGLTQAAIGLAVRHGTRPKWLQISRTRARKLLLVVVGVAVIAGLAGGAPSRLTHAWHDFKQGDAAALHENALGRFGSASGNSRYEYWKVSLEASGKHLLGGWGPGTFELVWLPRAPNNDYVQNAHSLYVETLLEDGVVGLALLAAFFLLVIGNTVRLASRSFYEERTRVAAIAAACVAFAVSAAIDWVWQIPVLPVAFLLLAAATLAPARAPVVASALSGAPSAQRETKSGGAAWRGWSIRAAIAAVAVACLIAIALPLAEANTLRESQAATTSGRPSQALSYAEAATAIEPGSAAAQLQLALVLELQGKLAASEAAARDATIDEPLNWSAWLVRSRLEAENGQPMAAVHAFDRARALNPHSSLFETG